MPVLQQLIRRFEELEEELSSIKWRPLESNGPRSASADEWRRWATSAMHLIRTAFGEASPHYANFKTEYERCVGYDYEFAGLKGVFLSASSDYRGGYVLSVEAAISGESLETSSQYCLDL